ncbi:hypothetical protein [Streptomyces sp. NBC_01236]|uniref:hypothetical protein n=1 Tax=Streptomyces sp. NBC_01236 TaxID=2903789 RepID=UPI002E1596DF|nr:hypothetical protein OG324_41635 [Streptomyces sp. NBC_01236]
MTDAELVSRRLGAVGAVHLGEDVGHEPFGTVFRDQHDETTARAGELHDQIEHLTSALAKTEGRLADLATARKVIAEVALAGTESEPPELTTAYQVIVNAFNTHPDQAFRVRERHELLGMPTDDPAMNVTRSRLGRLTRQGFLTQPGRGLYQIRA